MERKLVACGLIEQVKFLQSLVENWHFWFKWNWCECLINLIKLVMIGVFLTMFDFWKQCFRCHLNSGRNWKGYLGPFKIVFVTWKINYLIRLFETKISVYGSSRSDKEWTSYGHFIWKEKLVTCGASKLLFLWKFSKSFWVVFKWF